MQDHDVIGGQARAAAGERRACRVERGDPHRTVCGHDVVAGSSGRDGPAGAHVVVQQFQSRSGQIRREPGDADVDVVNVVEFGLLGLAVLGPGSCAEPEYRPEEFHAASRVADRDSGVIDAKKGTGAIGGAPLPRDAPLRECEQFQPVAVMVGGGGRQHVAGHRRGHRDGCVGRARPGGADSGRVHRAGAAQRHPAREQADPAKRHRGRPQPGIRAASDLPRDRLRRHPPSGKGVVHPGGRLHPRRRGRPGRQLRAQAGQHRDLLPGVRADRPPNQPHTGAEPFRPRADQLRGRAGPFDVANHTDTADRVLGIHIGSSPADSPSGAFSESWVDMLFVKGFDGSEPIVYLSTDAGQPLSAVLERSTYVPALNDAGPAPAGDRGGAGPGVPAGRRGRDARPDPGHTAARGAGGDGRRDHDRLGTRVRVPPPVAAARGRRDDPGAGPQRVAPPVRRDPARPGRVGGPGRQPPAAGRASGGPRVAGRAGPGRGADPVLGAADRGRPGAARAGADPPGRSGRAVPRGGRRRSPDRGLLAGPGRPDHP